MAAPKKPAPKAPAKVPAAPAKAPARPPRPETPRPSESAPVVGDYALPNFPEPSALAEQLARYLGEHNLVVRVGEAEDATAHVGLAGWQFVGAQLGQAGVVEWVKDTTAAPDPAYNYHARAQLIHVASGRQLGAGEAVASSNEPELTRASANIVASIAQNRALANAFYHSLGWLMRLAGVEAAPMELVPFLPGAAEPVDEPADEAMPVPIVPAVTALAAPTTLRQAGQALADAANATAVPAGPPIEAQQKEELIRLCNHPLIRREEKTKVHMRLNTYDVTKAAEVIAELKNRIDKRENQK